MLFPPGPALLTSTPTTNLVLEHLQSSIPAVSECASMLPLIRYHLGQPFLQQAIRLDTFAVRLKQLDLD
jgi:hypothetical protein